MQILITTHSLYTSRPKYRKPYISFLVNMLLITSLSFSMVLSGCDDSEPVPKDYRDYPVTPGILVPGSYGAISDVTIVRTSQNVDPEHIEYTTELAKAYVSTSTEFSKGNIEELYFFLTITETAVDSETGKETTQETILYGHRNVPSDYEKRNRHIADNWFYFWFQDGEGFSSDPDYDYWNAHDSFGISPYGATAVIIFDRGRSLGGPPADEFGDNGKKIQWQFEAVFGLLPHLRKPILNCESTGIFGASTCRY